MQNQPSEQLVAILDRLGLITPGELRSQIPQVKRLAGDLPLLDSIWVDALAQSRLLTPFQAAQINAGRGEQLAVGPFVLVRPLVSLGYADCFEARRLEDSVTARLYLIRKTHRSAGAIVADLAQLVEKCRDLDSHALLPIVATGEDQGRIWAVSPQLPAITAAASMIENGRFSPNVVLEIARTVVAALARLEFFSLLHGDVSATALLLENDGNILLSHPGLRCIIRPSEGYSHGDLSPEAYDYLAPERISTGEPPTTSTELYACGCLFWQLLAGRPPLAGGNSLAKIQSAHSPRIADIRQFAPDIPQKLAQAIGLCLARNQADRPANMAALSEMIGAPTAGANTLIARILNERKRVRVLLGSSMSKERRALGPRMRLTAGIAIVSLMVAACWPAWQRGELLPRLLRSRTKIAAKKDSKPPAELAKNKSTTENRSTLPQRDSLKSEPTIDKVAYWTGDMVKPLVLPTDRPVEIEKLSLERGQTVQGVGGGRVRILISERAWTLAVEEVTFQDVDFVIGHSRSTSTTAKAALVVAAARAEFRGCSFRINADSPQQRTAILWRGPTRSTRKAADWNGRLALRNCVVSRFDTAINCPTAQRVTVELANSLFVACNTVVRFDRAPRADEACELMLEHVTARQTGPVVGIHYEGLPAALGQLTVAAQESTFAPRNGEPLLLLAGDLSPDPLLAAIEWEGQGSLVTTDTPIAIRRTLDGTTEAVDDDELPVAGLVRSEVDFSGKSLDASADSRTIKWQVPLQSTEPPGIGGGLP